MNTLRGKYKPVPDIRFSNWQAAKRTASGEKDKDQISFPLLPNELNAWNRLERALLAPVTYNILLTWTVSTEGLGLLWVNRIFTEKSYVPDWHLWGPHTRPNNFILWMHQVPIPPSRLRFEEAIFAGKHTCIFNLIHVRISPFSFNESDWPHIVVCLLMPR